MPTTLRFSRGGTHKRPYFRLVATNSRNPRDSKFIEKLGTYDPLLNDESEKRFTVNAERVRYWLGQGAQMSDRAHLLLNKAGIVDTKPAQRAARKPKKEKAAEAAAPAPAKEEAKTEAPAAEAAAPDVSAEASAKAEAPKEETPAA